MHKHLLGYEISSMVGSKKQNQRTQNKLVLYFVNTIKDLFIFSINNFVLGAYIFFVQSLTLTSSFEKIYFPRLCSIHSQQTMISSEFVEFCPKTLLFRIHHQRNVTTELTLLYTITYTDASISFPQACSTR